MNRNKDVDRAFRKRFEQALSTRELGRTTKWLGETGSTNKEARAWADKGAPNGALIFANHQSQGRGRHDRNWLTSPGLNLTVSLILRPTLVPHEFGLITLGTSLAVRSVVKKYCPAAKVQIKWPNDILADGKKCCGMLLESAIGKRPGDSFVVLGVGINVNQVDFPDAIEDSATSMMLVSGQLMDRGQILADLLNYFEPLLSELEADSSSMVSAYQSHLAGIGSRLRLNEVQSGISHEGIMLGVDETGALLMNMGTGTQAFHAGEVKLLVSDV